MSEYEHSIEAAIENSYYQKLAMCGVPEHLHDGLVLYFSHRYQPGDFLLAVLRNDLTQAVNRSDDTDNLAAVVRFLVWNVPSVAWGSPEKVKSWLSGVNQ